VCFDSKHRSVKSNETKFQGFHKKIKYKYKENKFMEIQFKNDSYIKSIDSKNSIRSKRADEQISYWQRHIDKFAEYVLGYKLPLYQRIWIKLFSNIKKN
jgi:hypothetical protein